MPRISSLSLSLKFCWQNFFGVYISCVNDFFRILHTVPIAIFKFWAIFKGNCIPALRHTTLYLRSVEQGATGFCRKVHSKICACARDAFSDVRPPTNGHFVIEIPQIQTCRILVSSRNNIPGLASDTCWTDVRNLVVRFIDNRLSSCAVSLPQFSTDCKLLSHRSSYLAYRTLLNGKLKCEQRASQSRAKKKQN